MTKYLIIILLGFAVGYLVVRITGGYNEKKEAENRIQTLPAAAFVSIHGDTINLHDFDQTQPLIIVYFHPECEHCQYEAKGIGQNAGAFAHSQFVMITPDDSLQRVKNFCSEYHLWELENIEILLDKGYRFRNIFGKDVFPSIYIYNRFQKLKKKFLGETKPEAVIKALHTD